MVVQSIHKNSSRASKAFISQNCAAIPSTLLESILFGTVKGSYTGAENRKGLFEAADGGTLFLDEINSMEMSMQAKLLKAIESMEIRRVGSTKCIKVNVRILSAVNESPLKAIMENKLREDLFYRIGVLQISLPRLTERTNDIEFLSRYFIKEYNQKMRKEIKGLHESVLKIFKKLSMARKYKRVKECNRICF